MITNLIIIIIIIILIFLIHRKLSLNSTESDIENFYSGGYQDCVMSEWEKNDMCKANPGTRCGDNGKQEGTVKEYRNIISYPSGGGTECPAYKDNERTVACEIECTPNIVNNDCYDTSIDNCSQDYCQITEDLKSSTCLNKEKCSSKTDSTECSNLEGCEFQKNITSNCEGKQESDCGPSNLCVWNSNSKKCFEKDSNYEAQNICGSFNTNRDQCNAQGVCKYVTEWGYSTCMKFNNTNEKASNKTFTMTYPDTYGNCPDDKPFKLETDSYGSKMYECLNDNQICSFKSIGNDKNNITDDIKSQYCFLMEAEDNNFYILEEKQQNNESGVYYTHSILRDINKLKHLSCYELDRLFEHSKSLLPSYTPGSTSYNTNNPQLVTAAKIIDFVEASSSNGASGIFSEETNTKCKVSNLCQNICENYNSRENCQNDNKCYWKSTDTGNFCIRKADQSCADSENCSVLDDDGNNTCEVTKKYNYRYCTPKMSCGENEYMTIDENKHIKCEKCPEGTFFKNGKCQHCPIGTYNDEIGATECKSKTECPLADNKYIKTDVDDISIDNISQQQIDKIYMFSSAIKDSMNLTSDRECGTLNKCNDTQFVTNNDLIGTEQNQSQFLKDLDKIKRQQEFRISNNRQGSQAGTGAPGSQSAIESSCFSGGDFNRGSEPTYPSTPLRFSQYQCSELTKCDENEFISNYDTHKNKENNMFIIDRKCQESSDCSPGTFVTNRVTSEYPTVEITKNDKTYDVFTRDRNCITCADDTYTDVPNMTKCVDQPYCSAGKKVSLIIQDFITSNNHELHFRENNLQNIKDILIELGLPPVRIDSITGTKINIFFNTETDKTGQIKFVEEDIQLDFVLFNYLISDEGIITISSKNENSQVGIVTQTFDIVQNKLFLTIEFDNQQINCEIHPTDILPKNRRIDCVECGQYTYIEEERHRNRVCENQPMCDLGTHYSGDPTEAVTGLRTSRGECITCAPDTYIGPPDQFEQHRIERCIDQPLLQKGQCAVNYNPDNVVTKMVTKLADGDDTYQDETDHRNPCKTHIRCSPGEQISPTDPIQTRQCIELEQSDNTILKDIKYIDRVTHRVINPFSNPQDCEEPNVLFINNPDEDSRAKYKKRAECVDNEFVLSCKLTNEC